MIDSRHKMAGLVAHLMQYYAPRELCSIRFPDNDPNETPEGLGFQSWWRPLDGMINDWYSSAQLDMEKPCVIHLCTNQEREWFCYITHGWRNGPFIASWNHPAIADNLTIVKRVAGLVGAKYCFLLWDMHDKRTGDFSGEVIMNKRGDEHQNEEHRLLRCYVSDRSFRIAWYAEEVEQILYRTLESGDITTVPDLISRGHHKLKNHMRISLKLPEHEVTIIDVFRGLDAYDFCE